MNRLLTTVTCGSALLLLAMGMLAVSPLLLPPVPPVDSESRSASPRHTPRIPRTPRRYTVINLNLSASNLRFQGQPFRQVMPVALNNQGQVVGNLFYPNGQRAVIWEVGHLRELPGSRARSTEVSDINDKGEAVGSTRSYSYSPDPERALLWKRDKVYSLKMPKLYPVVAQSINEDSIIIGNPTSWEQREHPPIIWENSQNTRAIRQFGEFARVRDINSHREIVGVTYIQGKHRAFLWHSGQIRYLSLAGDKESDEEFHEAVALNEAGQVVGTSTKISYSRSTPSRVRSWIWDKGRRVRLGTLGGQSTDARSINSQGQVVGTSNFQGQSFFFDAHAFLWENDRMHDLNHLIPPHSGWTLTEAVDVNDRGEIIGEGVLKGKRTAFLLIPR